MILSFLCKAHFKKVSYQKGRVSKLSKTFFVVLCLKCLGNLRYYRNFCLVPTSISSTVNLRYIILRYFIEKNR